MTTAMLYALGGRGFILLRSGFLGGGITSVVPPLAVIFSAADFEKWWALTISFLVNSPVAEDADAVGRALGQAGFLQGRRHRRCRRP